MTDDRGDGSADDVTSTGTMAPTGPWNPEPNNPVIRPGADGEWDDEFVANAFLYMEEGTYHVFYLGSDTRSQTHQIGHATSTDLVEWTKDRNNPVLTPGDRGTWDERWVVDPSIVATEERYYMFYNGYDDSQTYQIGLATSQDLVNWTKDPSNPVLPSSESGWDGGSVFEQDVVLREGTWYMTYAGTAQPGSLNDSAIQIGFASGTDPTSLEKSEANPVISPGTGWDSERVLNTALIHTDGQWHVFYRGDGTTATNPSLGRAYGDDLSDLTKSRANPEFEAGEAGDWAAGRIAGPTIIRDGGGFVLMYHGMRKQDRDDMAKIGVARMCE